MGRLKLGVFEVDSVSSGCRLFTGTDRLSKAVPVSFKYCLSKVDPQTKHISESFGALCDSLWYVS